MDALLAADYTLLGIDWAQTRDISQNCKVGGGFFETNPLIGHCPSMNRVNGYFALSFVGVYELADTLEPRYRDAFLYGLGALELSVTTHNAHIGLQMKF